MRVFRWFKDFSFPPRGKIRALTLYNKTPPNGLSPHMRDLAGGLVAPSSSLNQLVTAFARFDYIAIHGLERFPLQPSLLHSNPPFFCFPSRRALRKGYRLRRHVKWGLFPGFCPSAKVFLSFQEPS